MTIQGQIQVIIFENSDGFGEMNLALVTFMSPKFFTGKGYQLPIFVIQMWDRVKNNIFTENSVNSSIN